MNIAIKDNKLVLSDYSAYAYYLLNSGYFKRKQKSIVGDINIYTLTTLSKIATLPAELAQILTQLEIAKKRFAIELANDSPTPLVHLPVKATLYKHQIRAINMALILFGIF